MAPQKSVITQVRNTITKLNQKITFFAKVYNHCHAALLYLGANEHTLQKFRILTKQDVKASSAIVDPNIPGSSSLQLSWIWKMSAADLDSPSHLHKCIEQHPEIIMILLTTIFTVQRVHWLHAQAQHNQWKEETILVGYEMQWTVRYYHNQGNMWTALSTDPDMLPGPKVYAACHAATCYGCAAVADMEFKVSNSRYISLSI